MQRSQIVKILILLLFVFNLIQWWPGGNNENNIEAWQEIQISQLKVNGVNDSVRHPNTRNLFYVDDVVTEIKPEKTVVSVNENISSDVPDIKLVGVIFKVKHYEAFVIKGEERFKVRMNEYIARRYKVKHINIKSIKLQDIQTGRMHEILLSDE